MPKINQKGALQIIFVLLILGGIAATVFLAQKTQIFRPKASLGTNISFVDASGNPITSTSSSTVKVKVTSPDWPQPTATSTTPTPVSTYPFGKAIKLDGKSYVSAPSTQKDSTVCNFGTLQMWVKMDRSNLRRTANIISKIGDYRGFDLSTNGSGTLAFYMYRQQFFTKTSLTPNKWFHIAVVKDFYSPTPANKRGIYIYVNGKVDGFRSIPKTLDNYCERSNGVLLIGRSNLGFIGEIDEVNFDSGILYTKEFVPPTRPFTGGTVIYHFDGNLLDDGAYKFSGQSAGNVQFVDSTIIVSSSPTSPAPTTSAAPITTTSVVLAEDPNFTINKQTVNFTVESINYTFSSATPGTKTLYAKFISSIGTEQNATPFPATITLEVASSPTPTPSPSPSSSGTINGFGKAVKVTSADSYTSTSLPGPVNFSSMALWIKPDFQSLSDTNPHIILGKEFVSGEISGFTLSVANKAVEFQIAEKKFDGSVSYKMVRGTTQLQANNWYYIAVFNIAGSLSMYVNGVQQGSVVGLASIQDNKDRKLVIGCTKSVNFACLSPFYGEIEEVFINGGGTAANVPVSPPAGPFTPNNNTMVLYHLDGDIKDAGSLHLDGQVTGNLQFIDSTVGQ